MTDSIVDLYNLMFYSLWLRKTGEEKQAYADIAIAAKGEEACSKPLPKTLKCSVDKVESDDEDDKAGVASDDEEDEESNSDEFEGAIMDKSLVQVRSKIKRYIANTMHAEKVTGRCQN